MLCILHTNMVPIATEDAVCKEVSVCVDGEETQLEFVDHAHGEISVENMLTTYSPDAIVG